MYPVEPDTLKARIIEDMKTAMKARDKARLETIRLIQAAIKQYEVDKRTPAGDTEALVILDKMAKQRRDSIEQFEKAGRDDLVTKEQFQLEIIQGYLPAALNEAELKQLIETAIADSGASGPQDMGKVMGLVKPKAQGRADMRQVSTLVKQMLAG